MTAGSVFGLAAVGAASEASSACLAPSIFNATPGAAGVPTRIAAEVGSATPGRPPGSTTAPVPVDAQPDGVPDVAVTTAMMVLAPQPMAADKAARPAWEP